FALLKSSRLYFGLALAVISVLVISFRISYLPVVIFGSLFLSLRVFELRWPDILKATACVLALFCMIEGYKLIYGKLSNKAPALLYADGFFLVAGISPLLTPDIFLAEGLPPEINQSWKARPLSWHSRVPEMWDSKKGIGAILQQYIGSPEQANRVAKRLAFRCIIKQPTAFIKLALQSYGTYLEKSLYLVAIQFEFEGPYRGPWDRQFRERLIRKYGYSPTQEKMNLSLVSYYSNFRPWFLLLLIFPLCGSILLVSKRFRSDITFFLMALYDLGALVITNGDATFRYLHPFPIILLLWLGWVTRPKEVNSR
ncbi:MAG: hypothetical protein ACKOA8_07785, partial [Deltaproteobacteria bacterium]